MSQMHDFLADLSAAMGASELLEPDAGVLTFEIEPDCEVHLQLDPDEGSLVQLCFLGAYERLDEPVLLAALAANVPSANEDGFTFGREPQGGTASLGARCSVAGLGGRDMLRRLCEMASACRAWRDYLDGSSSDHRATLLPLSDGEDDAETADGIEVAFGACLSFVESEGLSVQRLGPDGFAFTIGERPYRCLRKRDCLSVDTTAPLGLSEEQATALRRQLLTKNFCLAGIGSSGAFAEGADRVGFYCHVRPAGSIIEDFKQACVLSAGDVFNLHRWQQELTAAPDRFMNANSLWV